MSSRTLLGALVFEVILFTVVAPSFLTLTNFFEVTRVSVEVGILAIAMTPVIVTGAFRLSARQRRRCSLVAPAASSTPS